MLDSSIKNSSTRKNVVSLTTHELFIEFLDVILYNCPKAKIPANGTDQYVKWATEFNRIHKTDKNSLGEIRSVLEFLRGHNFWSANILSPQKLRKQFPTLWTQLGGKNGYPQKAITKTSQNRSTTNRDGYDKSKTNLGYKADGTPRTWDDIKQDNESYRKIYGDS